MKNRFLPFGFLALFLGFSLLLFSAVTVADNPENNPVGKKEIDRMHQIRANQVTGVISPMDMLKASMQLQNLQTKSTTGLDLNWTLLGPDNLSGRAQVVLFDNRDPDRLTIYTGGITGGVYRSTNFGLTWNALNQQSEEVLKVSSMTQTSGGTIYVGTGEAICGEASFIGTGLYRSENGVDFIAVPGTRPNVNNPSSDWATIQRLACDLTNNRLYAATNTGLKYSDDGTTWQTAKAGYAIDVVVGSDGTVMMVVDLMVYIAPNGDLNNLINVSTGDLPGLPNVDVGWVKVAIAPGDPSIMYAAIARSDYFLKNVYRSSDKGNTWSIIFPANTSYEPFAGYACSSSALVVFPDNPDKVLLGGINAWTGTKESDEGFFYWEEVSFGFPYSLYTFLAPSYHHDYQFRPNNSKEFVMATDNGISTGILSTYGYQYQTSNKNLKTTQINSASMTRLKNRVLCGGENIGVIHIGAYPLNNPEDAWQLPIFVETGTFTHWSNLNPDAIFYSYEDFGANPPYDRSEDMGVTIALTFLGGISSTATDYLPSALWETANFPYTQDSIMIYARDSAIMEGTKLVIESRNCTVCDFTYIVPQTIPAGDSMMVPDPYHARFFIFGSSNGRPGIYMSQDPIKFYKEPVWYQIAELPSTDLISCMALSDDVNYLWAGTTNGKIYRISNLTLALDSVKADVSSSYCIVSREKFDYPQFENRYITSISVDKNNPDNILVTLGNYGNTDYIYVAQNGLDSLPTFVSAQGTLSGFPVFKGIFEMHEGDDVLIGTDFGLFTTNDVFSGNPLWEQNYSGMGNVPVTDLYQQSWEDYRVTNLGWIVAATYGKGVFYDTTFYTPLGIEPGEGDLAETLQLSIQPNPVRDVAFISYHLDQTTAVTLQVYDFTGKMILRENLGIRQSGDHRTSLNLSALPVGTYVVEVNKALGKVVKIN